ncbi:type II secretion system protein [Candidatus Omnitrophota bacterium]
MLNKKGFTLIEMVMVIVILGILAIVAIPRFFDLTTEAEDAAEQGIVGAVRSGIVMWRANECATAVTGCAWPTALDANGDGACATCFDAVLEQPISTNWTLSGLTYTNARTTRTWTYVPATGVFDTP